MYLKRIQITYAPSEVNPLEGAVSFYSTTPSERTELDHGIAEENMGKLLSRRDYYTAIPDVNGAASRMLNAAVQKGYVVRQHHYLPSRFAIPTSPQEQEEDPRHDEETTPSLSAFLAARNARGSSSAIPMQGVDPIAKTNEEKQTRFAMPPSFSAAQFNRTATTLPAVGRIPNSRGNNTLPRHITDQGYAAGLPTGP
ncbi:hypothetical protein K435DRAFT_868924, partial [Dendrothele bispora CBS 962.96]